MFALPRSGQLMLTTQRIQRLLQHSNFNRLNSVSYIVLTKITLFSLISYFERAGELNLEQNTLACFLSGFWDSATLLSV